MSEPPKKLRADAARNRARVLEVAYEVFAAEGIAVPIDEIARRAGVGAGTVYRHFPTKEALFGAIVVDRVERMVAHAEALAATHPPAEALFTFLRGMADEGAADQGLVEALAGVGFDLAAEAPAAEDEFMRVLARLLAAAQADGGVRVDLDVRDLKVLLVGCQAMQRYAPDPSAAATALTVLIDGLTASAG